MHDSNLYKYQCIALPIELHWFTVSHYNQLQFIVCVILELLLDHGLDHVLNLMLNLVLEKMLDGELNLLWDFCCWIGSWCRLGTYWISHSFHADKFLCDSITLISNILATIDMLVQNVSTSTFANKSTILFGNLSRIKIIQSHLPMFCKICFLGQTATPATIPATCKWSGRSWNQQIPQHLPTITLI